MEGGGGEGKVSYDADDLFVWPRVWRKPNKQPASIWLHVPGNGSTYNLACLSACPHLMRASIREIDLRTNRPSVFTYACLPKRFDLSPTATVGQLTVHHTLKSGFKENYERLRPDPNETTVLLPQAERVQHTKTQSTHSPSDKINL